MNQRSILGQDGERLAARYLEDHGFRLLERNFRCRLGEIDVIARDGQNLVFVEVKSRRGDSHGSPAEAVGIAKRRRLAQVALVYIQQKKLEALPARFDVVCVDFSAVPPKVELIENAFDVDDA